MDWWTIILVAAIAVLGMAPVIIELIDWSERRRRDKLIKLERELLDAAINDALKRKSQ